MNKTIIQVKNYNKKFKKFRIKNINFNVEKSTVHALVGTSGSGKTILLKSIVGAINPFRYRGKILVNNKKPHKIQAKNSLGFSLNLDVFPTGITAYDFLLSLSKINHLAENEIKFNLEYWLKTFNLWEHKNKKLNYFSAGMKNRIMIIHALVHNPNLIILDEPGANLDSESRKLLIKILKELKTQGKTILLTTHVIDEFKEIIDECTIVDLGKQLYTGTIKDLKVDQIYLLNTNNNKLTQEVLLNNKFNFKFLEQEQQILVTLQNNKSIESLSDLLITNEIKILNLSEKVVDLLYLKSTIEENEKFNS